MPFNIMVKIIRHYRIHSSRTVGPQSLRRSRHEFIRYLSSSAIYRQPVPCLPIYFMSVIDGDTSSERIDYIGKTNVRPSAKYGRFNKGHAAITTLHDPRYDQMNKMLYMAQINVVMEVLAPDVGPTLPHKIYKLAIPLEWLPPRLQEQHHNDKHTSDLLNDRLSMQNILLPCHNPSV